MTNNATLNNKALENNGGLYAKNIPSSTVYLGKNLNVIGDDEWTFSLCPEGEKTDDLQVYHKDATNRYAFLRGAGYDLTVSSYSKRAVVIKVTAQEGKIFRLKASVLLGSLESVMAVNNRFWYASKIDAKYANKGAKNGSTDTLIEKCAVELYGDFSDAGFDGNAVTFLANQGGEIYIYLGVGEGSSERAPSITELRNGSYARMLNYSLSAPFAEGAGLGGLARELPLVYAYKGYDADSSSSVYADENASKEECALVSALAGDLQIGQMLDTLSASAISATTVWTAFTLTRNHNILGIAYDLLKVGEVEGNSVEQFLYYEIMERISRILGKDNSLYLEKALEYRDDALKTLGTKASGSQVESYYRYLLALYLGDYALIQKERENALHKFTQSNRKLCDYIYYFIALYGVIGVNAFTKDLRPALNFGTLGGSEVRVSNLVFFSKKTALTSFKNGLKLSVENKEVFSLVGGTCLVTDFKEEIGGVSFNVKASSPATLTLTTPPFSSGKAKNNVFKLRIGEEYVRVVIKNNKLKIEKL